MHTISETKILLIRIDLGKFELTKNITPEIYFFQKKKLPMQLVFKKF